MAGPSLLNDIPALLLQFHLHQFGVSTDIEKAFLQVGLAEEDRGFTRFFWLHDIDELDGPMDIYRFKGRPFWCNELPVHAASCDQQASVRRHLSNQHPS